MAMIAAVALLPAVAMTAEKTRIVAFGDSLSAGYGVKDEEGFVPQLQAALRALGAEVQVESAAISGDTSLDGRQRVDWMLRKKPDIVIVALGANDMLRAQPPALTYDNLDFIINRIHATNAKVLLAGMLATPTLGEAYVNEFAAIYPRLAEKHQVALFPFFLQDVATVAALNLPDGLHPNPAGIKIIAANIAPQVLKLLRE